MVLWLRHTDFAACATTILAAKRRRQLSEANVFVDKWRNGKMPKLHSPQTLRTNGRKMAKSKAAKSPKPQSIKKTIHLDVLADGVLDALATIRKKTNSDLVSDLLISELYRAQGAEYEAIKAVLAAQGISVPRRKNGTSDDGRAGQGGENGDTSPDGVLDRNKRLGKICESTHAPVDDAVNELADELQARARLNF